MDADRDAEPDDGPLDEADPRFVGVRADDPQGPRPRRLVESQGPGASPQDARVRILRVAVPALFFAGIAAVVVMFFLGLSPRTSGTARLGPEEEVRARVAERPIRFCLEEGQPCAWLSQVDGSLIALSASGPTREELGRAGIGWCASSGYYGSNVTGSRYDQLGRLVEGPGRRDLDRFDVRIDGGEVLIRFTDRSAGRLAHQTDEVREPDGPACERIPFEPAEHVEAAP